MANLFPVDHEADESEVEAIEESSVVGYKRGLYFDGNDLVRDGQNKVIEATGLESWEQWCKKCLSTERYSSPIYSTDFGIEMEDALRAETHELAESILSRQIEEALLADPYGRTEQVESITYDWKTADSVEIEVVVIGIEEATIDITVFLGGVNG